MSYEEFLSKLNIISKDEYNDLVESIGESFNASSICYLEDLTYEKLAKVFINTLLYNFSYCFADTVDPVDKTFKIWDIESKEELEQVKKLLPKWTVTNEDEILDLIKEAKINREFDSFLQNLSPSEKSKIMQDYENKKRFNL